MRKLLGRARAVFTNKKDWSSLGLNGTAAKDLQKFLTESKASYTAGKTSAYTAGFTKRAIPRQPSMRNWQALKA